MNEKLTVWIVWERVAYEGDDFLGVYASEAIALSHFPGQKWYRDQFGTMSTLGNGDDYFIQKYVVISEKAARRP